MTTNSDADVIHALSCSIGHISRQRVRFIQMELRKFATDSRIRNERHFWTLLENNGVRFSARTAQNFLSKIKDQRGINVETAMQYLKNSHRRTRRDSVEAMVTINMPKKGKKHQTDTAPELVQKNASRRMSLDEFRRVGRMVVNVASISGASSKSKLSYLQETVSSGRMSPKSLLEDIDQEEYDDGNNSINSSNSNLFKILLEEPKSDVEEDVENGKPTDDYPSPAKDLLSLPEPVNVSMPPIVIDQDEILQAARKKKKKKNGKSKKSKTQPPCHITITIEDVDKEKSEGTIQPIFDGIPEELGDSKSVHVEGKSNPGCMDNFKSRKQAPPSNAEDLNKRNDQELQEILPGRYIAEESVPLVDNSNKETEISTTEVHRVTEETETADKIEERITSTYEAKNSNEEEGAPESARVETEIKSSPKEGSILGDDDGDDGASAEREVPENIESSTRKQSDEENPLAEKGDLTTEFIELNRNKDVESAPPQDEALDQDMMQTKVVIDVEDNQDTKSIEECYSVDKHGKMESTEFNQISSGGEMSESLAEVKEPLINQEESSSGTEESELHWLSTDEDEEDEKSEKEIDFDTTSIADFGGEMVEVGENFIEMFPPDWTQNKEYMSSAENTSNTSQPKLDLNWVYGCDVTNAQSIVSLDDEILYGSGCIVVLYNHARNSQRHYIGHSGPITCIAVHSDKTTVGSAQGESPTAIKMLGAVSESLTQSSTQESYHGRIHVRVWKPEDLSTLFVMGVGSLQNNIRKMHFMNCRNYILTIEEDEESSLTLWDRGCKIKRIFSAPKSFTESTDQPRSSVNNKLSKAPKTSPKKVATNVDSSTRGIATSLTRGPEFVLAGKEHLGFWRIKDQDYSSSSPPKEDFVKIIGPIRGDFVKQFRPRYVTCCHSAERSGSGLFVSGDTNGTILVWSEELKEVIGGAKHAHECSVSCVLPTKFHIFSGGVTDREIKAFSWGKEELECVGSIILPFSVGQVASLSLTGSNLFVGTTQNLIVTVELNHPGYSYHTQRTTNVKVERRVASSLPNSPRNKNQESNGPPPLFSDWYPLEIARGFKGRTQCVCAVDFLKKRTRSRHLTPQPTNDTTRLKNAGVKNPDTIDVRTDVRSVKSAFQTKSNMNNARGKESTKSVSSETLPRPLTAFSSPKLRTSERVLKRERARNQDILNMTLPKFAEENFVDKRLFLSSFPKGSESISAEITTKSENSENEKSPFFVTASSDGWVVICDATEHSVVGRMKMPSKRDITCIDCSSKRSLLALGSSSGHVTMIHIHIDGFEMNNEQYFRGSCGGSQEIEAIKFSKNGQKIAFSVSSDIVLAFVKSSGIQEIGRCSGHKSEKIISIDWSSVSLKNSELLRSSALGPEPELFVWWADTMKSVEDLSIVRNVKWKSNSCSLDYAIKGIWDYFKIPTELTCVTVSEICNGKKSSSPDENHNTLSVGGFVSSFSNWSASDEKESETPDNDITCCAGDVLGCVRAYHYPFVSQDAKESVSCVYHSAVADVTCFDGKLITTSKDDRNIIQFDIKARHGSNSK